MVRPSDGPAAQWVRASIDYALAAGEATRPDAPVTPSATRLPELLLIEVLRMHLAQNLLATTTLGVAAIARQVGYDAEESFGRAFKRHTGQAPGAWRTARS